MTHSAEMTAPPRQVFELLADLAAWPRCAPHFRWIHVVESQRDHQVVRLACRHGWLPLDWVCRFQADSDALRLQFQHLKALTRGMGVICRVEPLDDGKATRVTITHDLGPITARYGRFFAEKILGRCFIHPLTSRTLNCFAAHFSGRAERDLVP